MCKIYSELFASLVITTHIELQRLVASIKSTQGDSETFQQDKRKTQQGILLMPAFLCFGFLKLKSTQAGKKIVPVFHTESGSDMLKLVCLLSQQVHQTA